jgi:hypothetical protein
MLVSSHIAVVQCRGQEAAAISASMAGVGDRGREAADQLAKAGAAAPM